MAPAQASLLALSQRYPNTTTTGVVFSCTRGMFRASLPLLSEVASRILARAGAQINVVMVLTLVSIRDDSSPLHRPVNLVQARFTFKE